MALTKVDWAAIALIIVLFAAAFYFYPSMPERMASHWNAQGQVNGYAGKAFALFVIPAVVLVMFLLMLVLPCIDPLKKNYASFKDYFDGFKFLFVAFLAYLYFVTIASNLGWQFEFNEVMAPAFAALFYYVGILVAHAKRNWFVGIRTPWTLSSNKVWDKTHRLGAKLFKASAVITLLGLFTVQYAIYLVIIPALATTVITVVYSYCEYTREARSRPKRRRK
jgi:uncharacterized membrane protein